MDGLSRAVGYCRVSTQRQFTDGHGLERYIDRLKNYGLTDEQIHWDIESGASENRKGYNKVLELVRAGKVDKLIVPCFDRFTRSALGWEKAREELQQFAVEVVFLDGGGLDLDTPEGVFTSRILAAMAAQLRDKNKYNATQGHRYFQEKRKIYRAIFGFVKYGDTVTPNLKEYRQSGKTHADVAREAIYLFLENQRVATTLRILVEKYGYESVGEPFEDFPRSGTSFKRWLQHPQLCGDIIYYKNDSDGRKLGFPPRTTVLTGNHEGIISREQFNDIQAILDLKPTIRRQAKNPLAGIAVCGVCGGPMEMHPDRKKYYYLRCRGHYARPGKPKTCEVNTYFRLQDAIASCIKSLQHRSEQIGTGYSPQIEAKLPPEIIELKRQILDLQRRNDPDLESAIRSKEQRLENLIRSTELNFEDDANRSQTLTAIAKDSQFWESLTTSELAIVFHELVSSLVCSVAEGEHLFLASFKI